MGHDSHILLVLPTRELDFLLYLAVREWGDEKAYVKQVLNCMESLGLTNDLPHDEFVLRVEDWKAPEPYWQGRSAHWSKLLERQEDILACWTNNKRSEFTLYRRIPLQDLDERFAAEHAVNLSPRETEELAKKVADSFMEFARSVQPLVEALDELDPEKADLEG